MCCSALGQAGEACCKGKVPPMEVFAVVFRCFAKLGTRNHILEQDCVSKIGNGDKMCPAAVNRYARRCQQEPK